MTRAEEAAFQLTPQVYLIQGERNEGETRDPPLAPIREITEIRAVDEYVRRHGKRRIRTFERAKSFKLSPLPDLPGLTPATGR